MVRVGGGDGGSSDDGGGAGVMVTSVMVVVAAMVVMTRTVNASSGIRAPPRVEPMDPNVLLGLGSKHKLTCPIRGVPTPMYEWYKDGEDVSSWPSYTSRFNTLRLKDADVHDSGRYTCLAVNGFGKANFTFNVIVVDEQLPPNHRLMPPTLTVVQPPSPVVVKGGEPLTLECAAEGLPHPTIHWSRDGLPLAVSGPRLVVPPTSLGGGGDGGLFVCTARNPLGTASANFSITVEAPERKIPKGTPEDGLTIDSTFNTTVVKGGNTTLQCTVTTEIRPEISWLKELPPSQATNRNQTVELHNRKFLTIKSTRNPSLPSLGGGDKAAPLRIGSQKGDVSPPLQSESYLFVLNIVGAQHEDQGLYVCLGINNLGYSYREAYLTVLAGPPLADAPSAKDSPPPPERSVFVVVVTTAAVAVVVVVIVIVCRFQRGSFSKSRTTTTTTIASPPPLNKYDDPSTLTPLHPDKQQKHQLPGLHQQQQQQQQQQYSNGTIKHGSKHSTMHGTMHSTIHGTMLSYNSTLTLPPPTLPPDLVYQDGLVYPPGKSRPLPPGGPSPATLYSDHYVYPAERDSSSSCLEPGYSDPYMEKPVLDGGLESGVDMNYTEALHTPHPNTPNPFHPPAHHLVMAGGGSPILQHHSPNLHGTPLPSTPNMQRYHQQQQHFRNNNNINNKNDFSYVDSSSQRTTSSNTNSPRDRNVASRTTASEQYYNSVSSSCGGDDYSSPLPPQHPYSSFHHSHHQQQQHPNSVNNSNNYHNGDNKSLSNNMQSRSSEHSYARLTPTSSSPVSSPPYGITFPHTGNSQSQFVVHYNL